MAGDEVAALLERMRQTLGVGTPAQAPPTSSTPTSLATTFRTVNPVSTDTGLDKYKTVVAPKYTAVSTELSKVDPSLRTVVGQSVTDVNAARTAIENTRATYDSRIQQLKPISGTIPGQIAVVGTKTTAITEGASQTRASSRADRLRKVLVELLAKKYAGQATQAGSTGGGQGSGAGAGTGGGGSGGGGGTPSLPSQGTLPTQSYSPQQIAALTALLAASKKKTGSAGSGTNSGGGSGGGSGSGGALPDGIKIPGGTSEAAKRAISSALAKRGLPYGWGANGPNSYDCSSLMVAAVKDATGSTIPRTTYDQIRLGQAVSSSAPKPGDLVFNNFSSPGVPEHVQMYIGDGKVIEAPKPGDVVKVSNYVASGSQVRRIFN